MPTKNIDHSLQAAALDGIYMEQNILIFLFYLFFSLLLSQKVTQLASSESTVPEKEEDNGSRVARHDSLLAS